MYAVHVQCIEQAFTFPCLHRIYILTYICDPLCETQAKVSKYNNEITNIKVWFLPLISLQCQSLIWLYSVNIKDIKVTFLHNVLYLMNDDFFCRKQQITKYDLSWVFTERVIYIYHNRSRCWSNKLGIIRWNCTSLQLFSSVPVKSALRLWLCVYLCVCVFIAVCSLAVAA